MLLVAVVMAVEANRTDCRVCREAAASDGVEDQVVNLDLFDLVAVVIGFVAVVAAIVVIGFAAAATVAAVVSVARVAASVAVEFVALADATKLGYSIAEIFDLN